MLVSAFSVNRPKRKKRLDHKNGKSLTAPIIIIILIVLADQVTKLWAVSALEEVHSIDWIGSFVRFSLVYNLGGAMGTKIGPAATYLITALVILPVLLWYLWHSRYDRHMAIPLSFIAGGAIGNLIDRIRIGKVIDFIDVDFFDFTGLTRFWTFNIADAAITCSIVYLIILIIFFRRQPDSDSQQITE